MGLGQRDEKKTKNIVLKSINKKKKKKIESNSN